MSTRTPEPIVLDTLTFFRYTPFDDAGFAFCSASMSARRFFKRRHFERSATDRGVHDTGLVGPVLHLTGFGVLDGASDIGADRPDLRVRHQASRTEHLTERTDHTHGVRGRDDDVELHESAFDALRQVVEADDVRTCCLGLVSLGTFGKHCDANGLAGTGGHHDGTADGLVGLLGIDAEVDSDVDGFIELGSRRRLGERERVSDSVKLVAVDLAFEGLRRVSRALP